MANSCYETLFYKKYSEWCKNTVPGVTKEEIDLALEYDHYPMGGIPPENVQKLLDVQEVLGESGNEVMGITEDEVDEFMESVGW